tara:strand:+ start:356 stop:676 length:321 start_codon:yes stop_codon:yes gene_type:complete
MKELLNFLNPVDRFKFLLLTQGVPGFLLIWLLMDYEISFWWLIYYTTNLYFFSLVGGLDDSYWNMTMMDKFNDFGTFLQTFFYSVYITSVAGGLAFISVGFISLFW